VRDGICYTIAYMETEGREWGYWTEWCHEFPVPH